MAFLHFVTQNLQIRKKKKKMGKKKKTMLPGSFFEPMRGLGKVLQRKKIEPLKIK